MGIKQKTPISHQMEKLFSYGTLRQAKIQRALYGRVVETKPDAIMGYCIRVVQLTDWKYAQISGGDLQWTIEKGPGDIEGSVLLLTPDELVHTDEYEPKEYGRVKVPLRSGGEAWAYQLVIDERQA
ncbi:MAG TPA: gamma-glutamylcyclotransferase family protein [Rhizomicrobium sp.]|nr:gamma-glutamylcyclotransferase family protein [Rhizomicrobium sp.]